MSKSLEARLAHAQNAVDALEQAQADATPERVRLRPVIGRPDGTLYDPATGRTWTPGPDEIVLRPVRHDLDA